ncbi:MAG TPA: hypothetical protein VGV57_06555 [Thermoleophilaceae bacterium]|nr:hypothetical protein [Thermoleophilaceae bacterium]
MVVKFPAYRDFDTARIAANDAMMALLIGARLGEHDLMTSAASPETRLPTLFGQIESIRRVNRTVGDAAQLLAQAEGHLAQMAIPYALAVHGAFVARTVGMLRRDGLDSQSTTRTHQWRADPNEIPLSVVHEYVEERSGRLLPRDLLEMFHLTRRVRNRLIHHGARAGSRLPLHYRNLPAPVRGSWERLAGRPLTVDVDGQLDLAEGELIAVLATSRRLADEVNALLAATLSRTYWAWTVVDDYASEEPQRFAARSQRLRRVRGYARTRYRPLGLTEGELTQALSTYSP